MHPTTVTEVREQQMRDTASQLLNHVTQAINDLAEFLDSGPWHCGYDDQPIQGDWCDKCGRQRPRIRQVLREHCGIYVERGMPWVKEREISLPTNKTAPY